MLRNYISRGSDTEVILVDLDKIETDEDTYQWRCTDWNMEGSERHVQELTRALRDRQRPLDPILVLHQETGFVIIDGHHRYDAYKEAKWDGPVPVEVFQGTPEEAELEALRRNIKDKLPMSQQDKLEAAWRLIKVKTPKGKYAYSKAKITEMTTVSNGTLGNMRDALEHHGIEVVESMSWFKVRMMKYDLDHDFDYDEHAYRKAEKLAKEIMKKSSVHFANSPDIVALALQMISETLPRALVEQWYPLAEELVEERSQYPDI